LPGLALVLRGVTLNKSLKNRLVNILDVLC
jgi:hypothetical protein